MQRTQIYITELQRSRIAELAARRGCTQSEVIREILDRGLGIEPAAPDLVGAVRETAGILADHPDWETWQHEVRGASSTSR